MPNLGVERGLTAVSLSAPKPWLACDRPDNAERGLRLEWPSPANREQSWRR
jgi:hypothetical protein